MMGLNLSNQQIAQELNLDPDDAEMTAQLRTGVISKKPSVILSGEVECDELYVIAGHKGQPEVVRCQGRKGVADDSKVNREEAQEPKKNHQFLG